MIDELYEHPAEFIESTPAARWMRICSGLEIHQGARMPEGYGIAWALWDRDAYVCAPMPWNLVLAFGYWLYGGVRQLFHHVPVDALSRAYEHGYTECGRQRDIHLEIVKQDLARELADEVRKAEVRGRQQVYAKLTEYFESERARLDGHFVPLTDTQQRL